MNEPDHSIIIFDGVCNLCHFSLQFIIKNDSQAKFTFVSAQSEKGIELQRLSGVHTLNDGTLILLKENEVYVKSSAAIEIVKELDGLWKLLSILTIIPTPVRDFIYSIISKYRYQWFGKKSKCPLPDKTVKHRFL